MRNPSKTNPEKSGEYVYCTYIVKNGVRIYPTKSKVFRFKVKQSA